MQFSQILTTIISNFIQGFSLRINHCVFLLQPLWRTGFHVAFKTQDILAYSLLKDRVQQVGYVLPCRTEWRLMREYDMYQGAQLAGVLKGYPTRIFDGRIRQ